MTPLYKRLKNKGNSFYAFPGAAEDISAAYQNSNYKMYFSKYVLLNFPKQNLIKKVNSTLADRDALDNVYFNFPGSFKTSQNTTSANFSEAIIESLRNYVANHEVVIRESRLNNTKYYYDTNSLETTTEKIFFKWCKKLGLIDFEPAIEGDEYFGNLPAFDRRNQNDDEYFKEYLWKEREVVPCDSISFYQTGVSGFNGKLEIEFLGETNFKLGDVVRIFNVSNTTILNNLSGSNLQNAGTEDGLKAVILNIIPSTANNGQRIVVDLTTILGQEVETTGQVELVYNRLVQYIGEISGVSNVQEANRSYTEVYAHIPDHTGMTPDILFRTSEDINYKSNSTFPIIPSQYQPEIVGAENYSSPIVSNSQNYPGSYFAQFDTLDFTYVTSTGDSIRRSGDYYGVSGTVNNPIINTANLDGLKLDFNNTHYVKMNMSNNRVSNFEQFNALAVDNTPPNDFEFNAIMWYYTVEDNNGRSTTNIYGVSFLDSPDNNPEVSLKGIKFPSYKKLVSNGTQDGTSYAFSLNLNFNIINENPQLVYNPDSINSLFSMNLFNKAMARLASTNDSFLNIITENISIKRDIQDLKGLIYTQTDLNTINSKINSLYELLKLYSTNQIVNSETVRVENFQNTISLHNIDANYVKIDDIKATNLYNNTVSVPINISVPQNKNWLVNIQNDDNLPISLSGDDNLTVVLETDLYLRQSCEFYITASELASQNKKLDIYINSDITSPSSQVLVLGDIDLPVSYNSLIGKSNPSALWKEFNFNIDFNETITVKKNYIVDFPISEDKNIVKNSIKVGDVFELNNFFVGTASVYDFSGQYSVSTISEVNNKIYLGMDLSTSQTFIDYYINYNLPKDVHTPSSTELSNLPYFGLNKGKKIIITRTSSLTNISDRYRLEILNI